ncbi:MAG: putative zinc transporter msc2, partial [Pleopsidium flavum]
MTTTYALPMNSTVTPSYEHTRSHSRRLPQERFPSQHRLIDAGPTSKAIPDSSLPTHLHPHSYPERSQVQPDLSNHQRFNLNAQLSTAESGVNGHIKGGAKGMEQLCNGGSLASRPQGDGYGFPIVDKNTSHSAAVSASVRTSSGSVLSTVSIRLQNSFKHQLTISRSWLLSNEIITSMFMPLPYLLVSFAYPGSSTLPPLLAAQPGIAHLANAVLNDMPSVEVSFLSPPAGLLQACTLTSGTLLLLGFVARIRGSQSSLDRRKRTLGVAGDTERKPAKVVSVEGAKRMAGRLLSVGLPFYASLKLGGGRSGLMMLIAGAGGLLSTEGEKEDMTRVEGWKRLVTARKWTLVVMTAGAICDVVGFTSKQAAASLGLGYLALTLSIFVLPPPFPQQTTKVSVINASKPTSAASTSAVPATPWENPPVVTDAHPPSARLSPLISTAQDTNLTLLTGAVSSILLVFTSILSSTSLHTGTAVQWMWFLLTMVGGATSLNISQPTTLCANRRMGFLLGSALLLFLSNIISTSTWILCAFQAILAVLSYFGVQLDDNSNSSLGMSKRDHQHHPHHFEPHANRRELNPSKLTLFLLNLFHRWPLVHGILVEKDSRRIFYFMSLNFVFMIIQFSYGLATDSLGLLSDSIHMAFDCLALAVGLCAAVMSKWPPSIRFPYGYGKMDTLAGFANGIFL